MKKLVLIIFVIGALATSVAAQNATPSRSKIEEPIRAAVYDSTLAALAADVKEYRRHASRHMLDLYRLMYEELSKNPEMKETFEQSGIRNADDFIANRVKQAASRFASLPRTQIAELARLEAAGPIVFVGDTEAKVRGVRVVLEAGEWKVDASEAIKKGLLRDHNDHLSPESRAKIARF